MRAVVQRVTSAAVTVDDRIVGEIDRGLLVFVGVERGDGPADVDYIAAQDSRPARLRGSDRGLAPSQSIGRRRQRRRARRVAVHARRGLSEGTPSVVR